MTKKSSLIWFAIISLIILSGCAAKRSSNDILKRNIITTVDSLKQIIYSDTIKFDGKDVVFTERDKLNINSYSMFYVVNGVYLYMLDIIPSDKVVEFVNEILDIDKIAGISVLPKEKVAEAGMKGVRAQNGIVAIIMKKNVKFNPFVAGLEKIGENSGDNFSKRKENELMITD